MQRHQFDSDVGKGGGIGREASFEEIEIGQSAGIEFALDGLGEFSLARPIMGQRQQPDHDAAWKDEDKQPHTLPVRQVFDFGKAADGVWVILRNANFQNSQKILLLSGWNK